MAVVCKPNSADTVAYRVIKSLADARGVNENELSFSLYDHIDIDAIERLREHGGEWSIDFTVDGHTVTVDSDDNIHID